VPIVTRMHSLQCSSEPRNRLTTPLSAIVLYTSCARSSPCGGRGGGGGVYGACEIKRDVEAKEEESALEREDRKLNRNITRGQVRLKVEGRCSRCIPWGQP
jgi:hypothetical protein